MKKDKLILVIEKLFPELNILASDNFQIFENKLQSHLFKYNNNKIEYLLEKYYDIEQVGKEIAEKGFTTTFDFGQFGFNDDRTKFYSDLNLQIAKVRQYLSSLYKVQKEQQEENLKNYFNNNNLDTVISDPIKVNLTQSEILGLIEAFVNLDSESKISASQLFSFCSKNFISKNAKSSQSVNSYKIAYYNNLYLTKKNSGKVMYEEAKNMILQKLDKISNAIKSM
jgi:hypothetical protein